MLAPSAWQFNQYRGLDFGKQLMIQLGVIGTGVSPYSLDKGV